MFKYEVLHELKLHSKYFLPRHHHSFHYSSSLQIPQSYLNQKITGFVLSTLCLK